MNPEKKDVKNRSRAIGGKPEGMRGARLTENYPDLVFIS
jgi:hypothetical protein